MRHLPAFEGQIKSLFHLKEGDTFLDLTLGDGGHSEEALDAGARVVSFDIDLESVNRAISFLSPKYQPLLIRPETDRAIPADFRWLIINANFAKAGEIKEKLGLPEFNAVLADLGTSQYQLTVPEKGLSFNLSGPLDMRLDQSLSVTAADLVNALSEDELAELFSLGDEYRAKSIAREIVRERKSAPIKTTEKLVEIITRVKGRPVKGKIHPATKVFMALRMAVNLEREALKDMLASLPSLLKRDGTVGIISFHSGEDRIVKQFYKEKQKQGIFRVINVKPIKPEPNELHNNPKVRSAKLRLAQKL